MTVDDRECEAASLAVELRMRRDFWRGKLALYGDREKFAKHARWSPNQTVVLMGLIWIPSLAFIAIIVFVPALFGWHVQWPSTVFIIVPFGMMAYGLWTRPSLRVRRTLILSLCPDCEYSLSELPDAIELPGEERSGPAVCPECGCPWPLVPPRGPH